MTGSEQVWYEANIESNGRKLGRVHDIFSLVLGTACGILRLQSWYGFGFYFIGLTIVNLLFYIVCCEGQPHLFFKSPMKEIFMSPLFSNIAGFIMMWCLVYALVL